MSARRRWWLPFAVAVTVVAMLGQAAGDPLVDSDGDGVPDGRDRCARTAAGAHVGLDGCSALQLSLGGYRPIIAGAVASAEKALTRLGAHEELQPQGGQMAEALASMESAAPMLAQGQLCEGANVFSGGVHSYAEAVEQSDAIVTDLAPRLLRRNPETEHNGDTDADDMKVVGLQDVVEKSRAAANALAKASDVVRMPCNAIQTRGVRFTGRVAELREAEGVGTLADGRTFAIPRHLADLRLWEGGDVSGEAKLLIDGSLWPGSITTTGIKHPVNPSVIDVYPAPCLELAVAPYQPLMIANPALVLHPLDGYERGGRVWLEEEMRLGVRNDCPGTPASGAGTGGPQTFTKRTMEIKALRHYSNGFHEYVLAESLEHGKDPVPLLSPLMSDGVSSAHIELVTTERKQACYPVGLGQSACSEPIDVATKTRPLTVNYLGNYCSATYANTIFTLDDDDASAFQATTVTGLTTKYVDQPTVQSVGFDAQGYGVVNGTSSRPSWQAIGVGTPFAVYNDDPSDSMISGTSSRSALMWPRVKGMDGGDPFWYSCRLPEIKRDAVSQCPSGLPTSYYRVPFAPGLWQFTQANDGDESHFGTARYAFDIKANQHTPIRAARGGVVDRVVEDSAWNCNVEGAPEPCKGNVLQIEHPDGSLGYYLHMPKDGIHVDVGDVVYRGQVIAEVGNTGYSTGPHVHFEARPNWDWSQTQQITFEVIDASYVFRSCYIPAHDEWVYSTNQ